MTSRPARRATSADHDMSRSARALPTADRRHFQSQLGYDFSHVRIHTDGDAARMNERLGSRAFTHGHDVYFARGHYRPDSDEGRRLLAHELAHVAQQRGRPGLIQRQTAPPTGATATATAEAKKLADLKSALISTYSLAGVVDGDETWTSAELQQVSDALELIPAKDREALKGVTLTRVVSLGGTTAGQFSSSQSVDDTTVVNEATLELADRAFTSRPGETVVHEVGHAVATLAQRKAVHAEHLATAEANRLTGLSNAAVEASNLAGEAVDETVEPLNEAAEEYNAARRSKDEARIAAAKATYLARRKEYEARKAAAKAPRAAMEKAQGKTKAAKARARTKEEAARRTAISKKDLARIEKRVTDAAGPLTKSLAGAAGRVATLSASERAESSAYIAAIDAATTAIEDFSKQTSGRTMSEDDVEKLIADVQATIDHRTTLRKALAAKNESNGALAAYAAVERTQSILFDAAKAHSLAHHRTARVQTFVTFVESKGIAPISTYALENWPHKPEEFYAEAYSMYLTRPTELEKKSAALHNWFKNKKY